MTIKIPKTFMGVDGKEALERILSGTSAVNIPTVNNQNSGNIVPNSDIIKNNPRNYIQVPQHNIVIAIAETNKGLDMYDTLDKLKDERLKMPKIDQFITHWSNVREAALGSRQLLYADRTPVSLDDTKKLWNYMSSTNRTPFNKQPCWTWLDAFFQPSSVERGKLEMLTDLRVIRNGNDTSFAGTPIQLQDYLHENGVYVDLSFNSQGFPKPNSKSANQSYVQGSNIYFYQPVQNAVARFGAGSDGAGLGCVRVPTGRGPLLGVFACAEGTAAKNGVN